jgi:hypothetical protein
MTTYNSTVNTYFGNQTISPSANFTGVYDSTAGFTTTKIVCSSAQPGILKLNYADTSAGGGLLEELYAIYANHPSALTSLIKKAYVQVVLENPDVDTSMTSVNLKTKFAERTPHPYLSYITDDVTANVTVDITDLTIVTPDLTRVSTSLYSGTLNGGVSSTAVDVTTYKSTTISYEDGTPTSSVILSLYGSGDNGTTFYYIGSILPIANTYTQKRYATITLNLTPFTHIKLTNESTNELSTIQCMLFSAT